MSDQLAAQLGQFYRDFNSGRIDFAAYRYRRGLLLDSLVDSMLESDENLETLPRGVDAPTPAPAPAPSVAEKKPASRKSASAWRLPAVIALAAIVVVAVVLLVLRQISRVEPDFSPAVAEQGPAVPLGDEEIVSPSNDVREETQTPDVGQLLVEDFIRRQDWRRMSVEDFQDSWGRLSAADRIVAKGAVWFEPLIDELQVQLDGARAVAVDPDNDPELDMLYGLSLRLGLVEHVPPGWTPPVTEPPRSAAALDRIDPLLSSADSTFPGGIDADAPQDAPADSGATDRKPETDETPAVRQANKNACSASQLNTRRRNCFDLTLSGESGPLMKVLPAGEFTMGSDESSGASGRQVAIDRPFAISVYEVTQSDYALYCEQSGSACAPPAWDGGQMPVVNVSWQDAVGYCSWLSTTTGQSYRLPTNEEWEYAARAGTDTAFPYGDKLGPAQARYKSVIEYFDPLPTSDDTTQKNRFGLWHMVGNVAEWVDGEADSPTLRLVRGGSYASDDDELRSAAYKSMNMNDKNKRTGFRVVREL